MSILIILQVLFWQLLMHWLLHCQPVRRARLFQLINQQPTLFEVVTGMARSNGTKAPAGPAAGPGAAAGTKRKEATQPMVREEKGALVADCHLTVIWQLIPTCQQN